MPLPTIVLLTDENTVPLFTVCVPTAFPEIVLLVKSTIVCGPSDVIAELPLLSIVTPSYVLFIRPAPEMLYAVVALLVNEKNLEFETNVVIFTLGPAQQMGVCAETVLGVVHFNLMHLQHQRGIPAWLHFDRATVV